ncbi:MAG: BlaI/MecI/CopY family transcriptional regulator [Candidatus Methanofastidiosia archaeon]
MLGPLEREVLAVMNSLGEGTIREIYEEMRKNKKIAYTTVSTTLERLFDKGYLSRTSMTGRGGTKHVYSLRKVKRKLARMFVNEFTSIFGKGGVSALHAELERLEK